MQLGECETENTENTEKSVIERSIIERLIIDRLIIDRQADFVKLIFCASPLLAGNSPTRKSEVL